MKVLFAGPSLAGTRYVPGVTCRPEEDARIDLRIHGPAVQGDIGRAVLAGASAIGLVDGRFDDVASVWHKEILFALSKGVIVLGAASMGALRAAECAAFGMIGIGSIFERYRSGELDDDAAVAQIHAPRELGYEPLSEALVNVEATIHELHGLNLINPDESRRLLESARSVFFKQRTMARVAGAAGLGSRTEKIADLLVRYRIDQKRIDALSLVDRLATIEAANAPNPSWRFSETRLLKITLGLA
jgi:hypothetical protein